MTNKKTISSRDPWLSAWLVVGGLAALWFAEPIRTLVGSFGPAALLPLPLWAASQPRSGVDLAEEDREATSMMLMVLLLAGVGDRSGWAGGVERLGQALSAALKTAPVGASAVR